MSGPGFVAPSCWATARCLPASFCSSMNPSRASRPGNASWMLISGGLALSMLAALLQQARIAIHPVYFDHNALYHVVQALALVLLYFGFLASRADSPTRAG